MAKKKGKPNTSVGSSTGGGKGGGKGGGAAAVAPQIQAQPGYSEAQAALQQAQQLVMNQHGAIDKAEAKRQQILKQLKNAGPDQKQKLQRDLEKITQVIKDRKDKLATLKTDRNNASQFTYTVPGVLNPTITPFMSGDDMIATGQANTDLAAAYANWDQKLADLAAQNIIARREIDKQQAYDRRDSADEAAARGLAHSSIRDAELYDIDATASLRRKDLDDQLSTMTIQAGNQKNAASDAFDQFMAGMRQKMVENAQTMASEMGQYQRDPQDVTTQLTIPRPGKGVQTGIVGAPKPPQSYTPNVTGGGKGGKGGKPKKQRSFV